MSPRASIGAALLVAAAPFAAHGADGAGLGPRFEKTVRPLIENYCIGCHSGEDPAGHFDMSGHTTLAIVAGDHARWSLALERLRAREMPPKDADPPTDAEREQIVEWLDAMRRAEAKKNAGDPGVVLARRLSNAEYNYSIRDLTGVDIAPAREFPVDPANLAGFDNSGESLAMSAPLLAKYLQAAREVANHLVLKPEGIAFAPHSMLVETDRDKYCVKQILDFYARQNTDYAAYFQAAWRFKHRAALGTPAATLARIAADAKVSPRYLATIWRVLEVEKEDVGPLARLQALWRALPAPKAADADVARAGCEGMRDFVVKLRGKTAFQYTPPAVKGVDSQPFLMWKNRQYASHRTSFDPKRLAEGADGDTDLRVPAGDRARYEAAFTRFCAVFPDTFYISERGRYFPDNTRDTGRHLSAGFHNSMGYFRDDRPLYELLLDAKGQKELDGLWRELDYVALGTTRTYVQYYLNDSGEVRGGSARPADQEILSEGAIAKVTENQLAKVKASTDPTATQAVSEHFRFVNETLRWVEKAHVEAEPKHVAALVGFAERAYRRPLSAEERADIPAFYRSLRGTAGLGHEDAMRDSVAAILMSPDFCYRIDLVAPGNGIRPLSGYALASRLSYFLWSSVPDAELLAHAAAGDLHLPQVLAQQARRMLKDPRVRGLATEFGGHWLDFRRFEQHNAVDREVFKAFDNELRQAMFEEPVRFMLDVFRENRSILDFLYASHTFVNPALAKHYGMPNVEGGPDRWVRVADAERYGRGGLLPMSVFLTQNAPGLRTSPVKRGYWVVKQVLGEQIPPPPAVVPEIPRDETKLDLPVRDTLARHREEKTCASCHARFDSYGLVFEGYGPVGERRTQDLAGRPVDDSATFPGGGAGSGLAGLRAQVRAHRQDDFVDNLSRKMLAYSLGRSVMLSDEIAVQSMRARLARDGYRIGALVESIVTSPQFLRKRSAKDVELAQR